MILSKSRRVILTMVLYCCAFIVDFFLFYLSNKQTLLKNCTDFREFSHCQPFYLFQYDSAYKTCHTYYHENCMIFLSPHYLDTLSGFTGVSMILPLTPSRMDRLYLHFQRWNGSISVAIQMTENELSSVFSRILLYGRRNIRYTFYIIPHRDNINQTCSFVTMKRKVIYYDNCFDINVLRNLAIETITTSHFLLIDGDGIISSTISLLITYT